MYMPGSCTCRNILLKHKIVTKNFLKMSHNVLQGTHFFMNHFLHLFPRDNHMCIRFMYIVYQVHVHTKIYHWNVSTKSKGRSHNATDDDQWPHYHRGPISQYMYKAAVSVLRLEQQNKECIPVRYASITYYT